jgi:hypothetical protein
MEVLNDRSTRQGNTIMFMTLQCPLGVVSAR